MDYVEKKINYVLVANVIIYKNDLKMSDQASQNYVTSACLA